MVDLLDYQPVMVLNWTRLLSMVDLLADLKLDQAALDG